MKKTTVAAVFAAVLSVGTGMAKANPNQTDESKAMAIAEFVKGGVAVLESLLSEHLRITPIRESIGGRDHFVMYVPMIKQGKGTRCSPNWSKDMFGGKRGRVRIELVNVPDEGARAEVMVQGKGDKQGLEDQNREAVLNLKTPVELEWGPGHSDDRAFYFVQRQQFNAAKFLARYPAAAFKIIILNPLP